MSVFFSFLLYFKRIFYFNDLLEDRKLFEEEGIDTKDFDNKIINELTKNLFKEEEFEEAKEEKEAENKKTKKRSSSHLFS